MLYGRSQNGIQGMLIIKFDFGLCRVYIDINGMWRYVKIQEITWLATVLQQAFISGHDGMMQIATFYVPLIDKEKLFAPALLGKFWLGNKTLDRNDLRHFLNRNQFFI